jgi:cytochrome bd-type quinol oxidase subunit 2
MQQTGGTATKSAKASAHRLWLAILALMIAMLGTPAVWYLSQASPFLRRTGLAFWAVALPGMILAIAALIRDRRRRTRVTAVAACLFGAFWMFVKVYLTALPAHSGTVETAVVPDVALTDHLGAPVRLRALARDRYLLLIFYRGHW